VYQVFDMAATIDIDDSVVATISGSRFSGNIAVAGTCSFEQGISGSLTKLVDGRSYVIAGANITIASASNGQTTITAVNGADASFLVLAASDALTAERVLTVSNGLTLADGGAGAAATVGLSTIFVDDFFWDINSPAMTSTATGFSTDGVYNSASMDNTSHCSRSAGSLYQTNPGVNKSYGEFGSQYLLCSIDGYWFTYLFGIDSLLNSATAKCFFGVVTGSAASNITTITGSNQPSSSTTIFGVGFDSGETTFSIMHNDVDGTATKVSTGITAANGNVYYLRVKVRETGSVSWMFMQLSSSNVTSGVISTDIPPTDSMMRGEWGIGNGADGGAVSIRMINRQQGSSNQIFGQSLFDGP
jgi:hypothetical protein